VRQAEADSGRRTDLLTTQEREEIRKLRREVFELRRANEILKAAAFFRQGARPGPAEVSAFINTEHGRVGVEPTCQALGVSASAYCERARS
jgi:hypothetical protein